MSRAPSLKDVQAAYSKQYGNKAAGSPVLKDVQAAYQKQYGGQGADQPSELANIGKNLLHGGLRGLQVGGAALSNIGRGIGDLEAQMIHHLGHHAMGIVNQAPQTYAQEGYPDVEKSMGLPDTPGYKTGVNVTSAMLGALAPGGLPVQMAMGAVQDPKHPLEGAGLGAVGVGAGKALGMGAKYLKKPLAALIDHINPSEKAVKATAAKWMENLPALRKQLENVYKPGYNVPKVFGKELVHEHPTQGGYFSTEDALKPGDKPLTVENSFPHEWLDAKDDLFHKISPVHSSWKNFINNPTIKNTNAFKEALNASYPKETDPLFKPKTHFIKMGKDILRGEFMSPTLARLDAEHGTNIWDQYQAADPAYSKEIENFGKNDKLDTATKGGAYKPSQYKKFLGVLDKSVEDGKVPIHGPVHQARDEIETAIEDFNNRKALAKDRGFLKKTLLGMSTAPAAIPTGLGFGAQGASALSRPIAQLLAQRNNRN